MPKQIRLVDKEVEKVVDFFAPEPLNETLAHYLRTGGPLGPDIHHPLVIQIGYMPHLNKMLNAMFAHKLAAVDKAMREKQWSSYVWLHERPYRCEALLSIAERIDDKTYWSLLGAIYVDSENLWQWGGMLRAMLTKSRPFREFIMDESERTALAALPDKVTIWRGHDSKNRMGWSWTLDRAKAEWFARRWAKGTPRLVQGVATKFDIIAHFTGRGESEIVIDPNDVDKVIAASITK